MTLRTIADTPTLVRTKKNFTGTLFAAPAFLGLLAFVAAPFILAIVLSFSNARLGSPLPTEYIGLEQYRRIFSDKSFLQAIANNTVFALVVVPLQTLLALCLALLLNWHMRGVAVFRALFFLPVVFPMSLVAIVWVLIYAPGPEGLLNASLGLLSFGHFEPKDYLHDQSLALPALMLLSIWQGVGFQTIILIAGLKEIPDELYQAAKIDKAGAWQRFLHITLPQLRNPLIFTVVLTSILAFRLFDQVQIMTLGGPNLSTTTVLFEAYQSAYERQDIGRASAMTVVFFAIVLTIAIVQRFVFREEAEVTQ